MEFDECNDLLTDEKLDELANLENGKEVACKEIDSRAMARVREVKVAASKTHYVFDREAEKHEDVDGIAAVIGKYDK